MSQPRWRQLGHAYLQKGLAYAHAVTGRHDLAAQILDAVLAAPDRDALTFHIALAYSGLGNVDQAFVWLERGLAQAGSFMVASRWSRASSACTATRAGGAWSAVRIAWGCRAIGPKVNGKVMTAGEFHALFVAEYGTWTGVPTSLP